MLHTSGRRNASTQPMKTKRWKINLSTSTAWPTNHEHQSTRHHRDPILRQWRLCHKVLGNLPEWRTARRHGLSQGRNRHRPEAGRLRANARWYCRNLLFPPRAENKLKSRSWMGKWGWPRGLGWVFTRNKRSSDGGNSCTQKRLEYHRVLALVCWGFEKSLVGMYWVQD